MALTLDFAFEGLKFAAKKPVLFLGWCVFYVLLSAAALGVLALMSGAALMQFIALTAARGTASEDPTAVLALFAGIWPGILVTFLISIAGTVMFRTAIYRAMLKPSDKSLAYLRFGGDEWRQIGLTLLLMLVCLGIYLGLAIGAVILIGLSSLAKSELVTGLVTFFAFLAVFVLLIWFGLRSTVAAPLTFDKGKLDVFGSLKLTKGNSWTLLGGFLILCILLMIIQIVVMCVFYGVTLAATGFSMEPLRQAANPDYTQILSFIGPVFIVQLLVGVLLQVLSEVAFVGAQVGAYKVLHSPLATIANALEDMADQDA
jgi:hypothetical protein